MYYPHKELFIRVHSTFNKNSVNIEMAQIYNTVEWIIKLQSYKELVSKNAVKCMNLKNI
jgi:hypothetical protein